jgi:hypothetical protein
MPLDSRHRIAGKLEGMANVPADVKAQFAAVRRIGTLA